MWKLPTDWHLSCQQDIEMNAVSTNSCIANTNQAKIVIATIYQWSLYRQINPEFNFYCHSNNHYLMSIIYLLNLSCILLVIANSWKYMIRSSFSPFPSNLPKEITMPLKVGASIASLARKPSCDFYLVQLPVRYTIYTKNDSPHLYHKLTWL